MRRFSSSSSLMVVARVLWFFILIIALLTTNWHITGAVVVIGILVFSPYWEGLVLAIALDGIMKPLSIFIPYITLVVLLVFLLRLFVEKAYRPRSDKYVL